MGQVDQVALVAMDIEEVPISGVQQVLLAVVAVCQGVAAYSAAGVDLTVLPHRRLLLP